MNKKIFSVIVLSVLCLLNCYSQNKNIQYFDKNWDNIHDTNGMVYYREIFYDSIGKPLGKVRDYFKSGKPQWEGYLKSDHPDRLQDTARWYFESGRLSEISIWEDGIKFEIITSFSENGNIENNSLFVNYEVIGNTISYYDNGKIKDSICFDKLTQTIRYFSFYPNGNISGRSITKHDTIQSMIYNKDGSINQEGRYIHRKGAEYSLKDGDLIYYYKNGRISNKCQYKEGKKYGIDSEFNESGSIKSVCNYVNGIEDGESILYDDNSNVLFRYNWINGVQNGKQTEYFSNGNIKTISYLSNGKDTGTTIQFDEKGRIWERITHNQKLNIAITDQYSQPENILWSKRIMFSDHRVEQMKFDKSGNVTEVNFYSDYNCISKTNLYFPDGRLYKRFYYSNCSDLNIDTIWFHNGSIQAIVNFKREEKSLYVSFYIIFDSSGNKIDSYERLHLGKNVKTCLLGFKNDKGEWIIKPEYEIAYDMHYGFAQVMKNNLWGILDNKGRNVLPVIYNDITEFEVNHFKYDYFFQTLHPGRSHSYFSDETTRYSLTPDQYRRLCSIYTDEKPSENYIFFRLTVNNLYGIADDKQIIIKPVQKYLLWILNENYFSFEEDSENHNLRKFGVLDRQGKIILPCIYESISILADRYFIVEKKIKDGDHEYTLNGIFNQDGSEILPCEYNQITSINLNIFSITKKDKIGFFDVRNKKVIPPKYDHYQVKFSSDTILRVTINEKSGLLDINLRELLPVDYILSEFKETQDDTLRNWIFSLNGKYGIMSPEGKIIIPAEYDTLEYSEYSWGYLFSMNKKWGLMDDRFNVIIKPQYISAKIDYNGEKYFATSDSLYVFEIISEKNFVRRKDLSKVIPSEPLIHMFCLDQCRLINSGGKFILPPSYKIKKDESGNFIAIDQSKNEMIYLDNNGNILLKSNKFTTIFDNYMGFLTVMTQTGKIGVVGPKGTLMLDTLYDAISKYDAESKRFWVKAKIDSTILVDLGLMSYELHKGWALTDTNGKFLTDGIYCVPVEFSNGLAVIISKDGTGVIDKDGNTIIPNRYNAVIPQLDGNYILYKKEEGFGLANRYGKIAFETGSFDNISKSIYGYYIFFKDNNAGLIDTNLQIMIPALSDSFIAYRKNIFKLIINNQDKRNNDILFHKDMQHNYYLIKELLRYGYENLKYLSNDRDFLKVDSLKNEDTKRIIMNYLFSLYGKTISCLVEGNMSLSDKTPECYYSRDKFHYDYSWDYRENNKSEEYSHSIGDILINCFSVTENHSITGGENDIRFTSELPTIIHSFRIVENKLDTLNIDALFIHGSNYPIILNALLLKELQEKSEMTYRCDQSTSLFEAVKNNFIIGRSGLRFFMQTGNPNGYNNNEEIKYLKLQIHWKSISGIIDKNLLKGIKI